MRILCLLLCICLFAVTAEAATLYSMAEVTKNAVNIRKSPGGKLVDRLKKGECVSIIGTQMSGGKEWDQIIVSRKTDNVVICGYVDAVFLEDVTEKYAGVVEAAPGDRHMVLRFEDGRAKTVGESFMDNLSINHWPRVRQVAVSRFMSAGVGMDDVLYTSEGYSKPDFVHNWKNVDAIFPCAEDINLLAVRDMDGRYYCGLQDYEWLFPERYTGAEMVAVAPQFSAALSGGQVMVTALNQGLRSILEAAESMREIQKITCATDTLVCLDSTGTVHVFTDNPLLKAADGWRDVVDIASASRFIALLFRDGTVRMCGQMIVRNRNYALESEDILVNFNDILSAWHNVAEIRATYRMLLGRTVDGHLYLLYPNRYE